MKTFNINEKIKLKLTEKGKQIVDKEGYSWLKYDNDGFIEMQMHEAFNFFGKYLNMGGSIPFETNIYINDNDLKDAKP
ncbi:hypothetical protein [Dysgonomonas massiliensis]|uniref:hypothetical protein n=1 Tax=Dysgonomonas massiliensis TaxID=2040292 RepID=UPI000C7666DB|nr:hypothetical protein [Dysgonomonas massiliensis]